MSDINQMRKEHDCVRERKKESERNAPKEKQAPIIKWLNQNETQ